MSRPNILIITTDQHRGDCYGFERRKVKTPHIDQLAAAGTRFQHCITPSAMCQPARASMLTGLYPLTHGVVDNGIDLPPETGDAGFAGQLGRNGYHTAFIGKAHFSSYNTFSPTGTPECHQSSSNFSDDWNGPYMGFEEAQLLVFDVWVMLIFGVIGFLMECAKIPLGPFVIGFVLAPLAEEKLRSGLMMTAGDFSPIFTRPLPLLFTILAVILLLWPIIGDLMRKRRASRK